LCLLVNILWSATRSEDGELPAKHDAYDLVDWTSQDRAPPSDADLEVEFANNFAHVNYVNYSPKVASCAVFCVS
jgi:hypothetical protein